MGYKQRTYWQPVCDTCGQTYVEQPFLETDPTIAAWPTPAAAHQALLESDWQDTGDATYCPSHYHAACAICGRRHPVCPDTTLDDEGWEIRRDDMDRTNRFLCPDCANNGQEE